MQNKFPMILVCLWLLAGVTPSAAGDIARRYVFSEDNCAGTKGKGDLFATRALRGSLYSIEEKHGVRLVRGRLLVMSQKGVTHVETKEAQLQIEPNSAIIVEGGPHGLTRVYCLASHNRRLPGILVQVKGAEGHAFGLLAGRELVVATRPLTGEDLLTPDGIERHSLTNEVAAAGNLHKYEFSLAQMASYDRLINCREAGSEKIPYQAKTWQDLFVRVLKGAELQHEFAGSPVKAAAVAEVKKQSGNESAAVIPGHMRNRHVALVSRHNRYIAVSTDAVYNQSESGEISLSSGELLARGDVPLSLVAGLRTIGVACGGSALVKCDSSCVKVVNLSEARSGSVYIKAAHGDIRVPPGYEAIVSTEPPTLGQVYDPYQVGHRSIFSYDIAGLGWLTTSEVSVKDLLINQPILASLRKGARAVQERKLVSRAMKLAAVQQVFDRGKGEFRAGVPDDATGGTMRLAARCNHCLD